MCLTRVRTRKKLLRNVSVSVSATLPLQGGLWRISPESCACHLLLPLAAMFLLLLMGQRRSGLPSGGGGSGRGGGVRSRHPHMQLRTPLIYCQAASEGIISAMETQRRRRRRWKVSGGP